MSQFTHKNARRFLTFSLIGSLLDVVRSLFVAKVLDVSMTGLCLTLLTVPQAAQYLNLGIIESMMVLVPHYRGQGDAVQIERLKATVLSGTLGISVISFVMVVIYAAFFRPGHTQSNYFLILSGSLIVLWELKQFFFTNYAAENSFRRLSHMELIFSLLVSVLQMVLVVYFNGYGFWFGFIIPNVIVILYAGREYQRSHRLHYVPRRCTEYRRIVPLGIGLLIASASYAPFFILARLGLSWGAGMREVGLFFLSMIVITKLSIIPSTIAKFLTPRISRLHGESEDLSEVLRLFRKAQLYTFLICLGLVVSGWFAMPLLVRWLLPNYLAGLGAAKVMLFAMLPYSLIDNANSVILVLERKGIFTVSLCISIVLAVIVIGMLLLSHTISAWNMSAALVGIFSIYAGLVNYAVIRYRPVLSRQQVALVTP